jgi:hypothetical protein
MNSYHLEAIRFFTDRVPDASPAELIDFALMTSRRIALRACPRKRNQPEITAQIQLHALQTKLKGIVEFLKLRDGEVLDA